FESENEFLIEGFDRHGNPVDLATFQLSVTFTGGVDPGSPNIVINEWMASNQSTLADPADGRFEDWLELYNAGSEPIDLAGYTLTDDLNFPSRWTFPVDTIIEPHGYLLIWLDGDLAQQDPAQGQWHASFSLTSAGECIGLFTPEGVRVDAVEFGPQDTDLSVGRTPDGVRTQPVCLASPTPGKANRSECPFRILEITLSSPQRVRLTWRSAPGELYVVEQSERMEPASWTDVSELVTAEGWSTTTDVGRLENQSAAYFRVKIVTP
ncbi:MAG: lamin tail domain-containing protein, partial [Verrucomicrobiota bacterium]|nr:lamin tail domain-containing protein [Verrucomicrobiota bacterium]